MLLTANALLPSHSTNRPQNRRPRFVRLGTVLMGLLLSLGLSGCELLNFDMLGTDSATSELVAFSSCTDLETHLKTEALRTANILSVLDPGQAYEPDGFVSGFADSPGTSSGTTDAPVVPLPNGDFSATNNQEANVAEADIVQVDATHAFTLRSNHLLVLGEGSGVDPDDGASAISRVDPSQVRILADVEVPGRPIEMFLEGNYLIIVTRTNHGDVSAQYAGGPDRPSSARVTQALVYDVTDRANPTLVREVAVEGDYIAGRRINDRVYLVARPALGGPSNVDIGGGNAFGDWLDLDALSNITASLDAWLPYTYSSGFTGGTAFNSNVERANCRSTYQSPAVPGDDAIGIVSFDFTDNTSQVDTTTIIGDGTIVYASTDSIIVAMTNYGRAMYQEPSRDDDGSGALVSNGIIGDGITDGFLGGFDPINGLGEGEDDEGDDEVTYLHRFQLQPDGVPVYNASAKVDGWILNQFSLSEYQGYVRVGTQRFRGTSDAESMVFTLRVGSAGDDPISALASVTEGRRDFWVDGQLRNIGVSEDLFAVRFVGKAGYLVTFRQTDPLWVVDLTSQSNPTLRGNLQVPGWSTYLHPIEGNRLLAIGRQGNGIKLSIFDVSDWDNPRAVDEIVERGSDLDSEALEEHRAFRYIPDRQLLAVPMYGGSTGGLYMYRVTSSGFESLTTVTHETAGLSSPIRRAYHIEDTLFAFSNDAVTMTNMDSLTSTFLSLE